MVRCSHALTRYRSFTSMPPRAQEPQYVAPARVHRFVIMASTIGEGGNPFWVTVDPPVVIAPLFAYGLGSFLGRNWLQ